MAAGSGGASPVQPSLPPPKPKSPPQYPDLYGKRRELARVQMLEREIGFLQEELKFFDGLPPASQSCKEVADFASAKADPLIVIAKKKRRRCRLWKWFCGLSCFSISCPRCCCQCLPSCKMPSCNGILCHCCNGCGDWKCNGCRHCNCCCCQSCCKCPMPKCNCRCLPRCGCSECLPCKCSLNCSIPKCISCSDCCSCTTCKTCSSCRCLRFPKVKFCRSCTKNCSYPCFCFF